MRPGTSPAITALPSGGFEIAFQANTGTLWTTGNAGTGNTGLGMNPASSPSIAALTGENGYQAAFEANTNTLWTTGTLGTRNTILGMLPGTNPSITSLPVTATTPACSIEVAFQAANATLSAYGTSRNQ